nr:asparaginase [uncultured Methanoregula sp.]
MIQGSRILLLLVLLSLAVIPGAAADVTANTLLPRIHIIATGGTIAGTASDATNLVRYDPGNLSVDALVSSVPGLDRHATVTCEQFSNLNSDDITPAHWLNLSHRVNTLLDSADVDGIVITHGTDTLEETAYFLSLLTPEGKPVVVTGAMRPATALSADGPLNLYNAVVLAGSPEAKGKGVLISLNGEINGARDTTKTNTVSVATFRSRDFGPLGYMDEGRARFYYLPSRNQTTAPAFSVTGLDDLPRVDIVAVYPGMDTTAIDAFVARKTKGLVIAGMGNGEFPETIHASLQAAADQGIPVVISSRTGAGITTAKDDRFISADTLSPQKARILLMLALTRTQDKAEIAEMFRHY